MPESSGGLDASSIPNGNVVCVHDRESGNLANDGAMRAGTVCTVECDHGYGLADADAAAAATCGPDGSWSGEIAQCLPGRCASMCACNASEPLNISHVQSGKGRFLMLCVTNVRSWFGKGFNCTRFPETVLCICECQFELMCSFESYGSTVYI